MFCAVLILFICIFSTNVFANPKQISKDTNFVELDTKVESLITSQNVKRNIVNHIPLYDSDDKIVSWACKLSPSGYVILDNNFNVVEFSFTASLPFSENTKTYYVGPLNYFAKKNNTYVNEKSLEKISSDEIKNRSKIYFEKSNEILLTDNLRSNNINAYTVQGKSSSASYSPQLLSTSNTRYIIPGKLRTYDNNKDSLSGSCGSCAASIMLMYYHDYVNSFMVPSWYATADGKSFTKLLIPNIEGSDIVNGSNTSEVAYGLNWYFRWRGISSQYNARITYSPSFSDYKSKILRNRPVEVMIVNHPGYRNHWVVGYGYTINTNGGTDPYYMIVNNGWGDNDVSISFGYINSMVYLNQ